MANIFPLISENITTTGSAEDALALGNGGAAYILPGVTVAALGSGAIGAYGYGGNTVEVYGTLISAQLFGIAMAADGVGPDGNNRVFIGEAGIVSGRHGGIGPGGGSSTIVNEGTVSSQEGTGIAVSDGDNHIVVTGTGTVSAHGVGVSARGGSNTVINDGAVTSRTSEGIKTLDGDSLVLNTGDVAGHLAGIRIGGSGNKVLNDGLVSATDLSGIGILIESGAGEANRIVNDGTISAGGLGVRGGTGDETVINRGAIEGSASLGAGADIYRGEDGVVLGEVLGGDGNDRLFGGSFDDALFGGADNDLLKGRAGDDIIGGGAGTDSLWGGSGLDVFDFDALADSAVGLGRDVVADFERGFDLVDLQGIDARAGAAGDQAFRFVGTAAFTAGSAGQLRAFTNAAGTQTIVEGDVNGDATADFQITLAGSVALSAADFLL